VMMGPNPVLPGTQTTATFAINGDGRTGTISGNSGCNTYNAPITGVLTIGPVASTNKLCPEPPGLMSQEARYLAALQVATSFTQAYNQLLVNTRNGLLVFYNSPAPLQPIAPPQLPPAYPELPPVVVPTEMPIAQPTVEIIKTATPTYVPIAQPTVEIVETATPTYVPIAQPTVEIVPTEVPLEAVITAPTEGTVGKPVKFDASASSSGGTIIWYDWDFGDGTKGSGQVVVHKYIKAGTYTVTLTIVEGGYIKEGAYTNNLTIADFSGKTDRTTHQISIK